MGISLYHIKPIFHKYFLIAGRSFAGFGALTRILSNCHAATPFGMTDDTSVLLSVSNIRYEWVEPGLDANTVNTVMRISV